MKEHGEKRNLISFHGGLEDFYRHGHIRSLVGLSPLKIHAGKGYPRYLETMRAGLSRAALSRFDAAFGTVWRVVRAYLLAEMEYFIALRLDVFRAVDRIYTEMKRELNGVDYTDIETYAAAFLASHTYDRDDPRDHPDHTEVLGRIVDLDIRHLLIDEFQDTSELEWRALRSLVTQVSARGGTLFYVGDEKQSIYRWRGGEPWLFERVRRKLDLAGARLPFSYRQNRRLVDFVNTLFSALAREVPDFRYQPQLLPTDRGDLDRGFVLVDPREERGDILSQLVAWIHRFREKGVRLSDMAVLCRKNREVEEIENLLRDHSIPHTSVGRSRLMKDPCILDLVGLIRFALEPEREIHLVSVLRTPLFRVSYGTIDRLRDENGRVSVPMILREEPDTGERLARLLRASRYAGPAAFLRRLIEDFDLFDRYPRKRGVICGFLELAYEFEESRDHNALPDFLAHLEDNAGDLTLRADGEGVSVQTIHSAKGLEYHTVLVPFLEEPAGFDFRNNPILFRRDGEGGIEGAALAFRRYFDFFPDRRDLKEILDQNERSYRVDEVNTLYVALTRARENLVILPLASARRRTTGDLLCEAVSGGTGSERRPLRSGEPVSGARPEAGREIVYHYMKRPETPRPAAVRPESFRREGEEPSSASDHTRRVALLTGLIFHRVMEWIDDTAQADPERLISSACFVEGSGFSRRESREAVDRVRLMLSDAVGDGRVKPFLSAESAGEVTLVSDRFENLIGRVDRIVVREERVDVLDFKTGALADEQDLSRAVDLYRPQIERYCAVLKEVFAGRRVRGMLYFTGADTASRLVTVYDE
jgi:ATP-dependent exoDNAse (exonuclease V) beta subunit